MLLNLLLNMKENLVDKLPDISDKPKGETEWVKAADFEVFNFTQKQYQNINWLGNVKEYRLSLDNLMTWQEGVDPQVKYFINNQDKIKNIYVVNYDGNNIIVDGNHRATAARILGWKKISVKYVDYEEAKINEL